MNDSLCYFHKIRDAPVIEVIKSTHRIYVLSFHVC